MSIVGIKLLCDGESQMVILSEKNRDRFVELGMIIGKCIDHLEYAEFEIESLDIVVKDQGVVKND